jgi:hypothetical protein
MLNDSRTGDNKEKCRPEAGLAFWRA